MARQRRSRAPLHDRASQRGELAAVVFGRREQLDLRQEELADLAGCSPRFVHELENGKQTIRLDKLVDVLGALGLHLLVADGVTDSVETEPTLRAGLGLSVEHPGRHE